MTPSHHQPPAVGYEQHLKRVDREFSRVFQIFQDRMQCRRGCSTCCSQMFSISSIEADYVTGAVRSLPEPERESLLRAAGEYVAHARALTADEFGRSTVLEKAVSPRPGLRIPCPALIDGACSIYSARPIICRKWGIPIFDPNKPLELQACELNFPAGAEVDVDGLIEPQTELLEEWVRIKEADAARAGRQRTEIRVTVAEAILAASDPD